MKKKLKFTIILGAVSVVNIFATKITYAQNIFQGMKDIIKESGLTSVLPSSDKPEYMLGEIVQAFMSILGIIFLLLIVYGGYIWMTAAGNEDRVAKAKKIIISSAIGIAVVFCAYLIAAAVIAMLESMKQ